ncbi:MAG: MotA/TolQ/ExbB proton channel family protein [Candidatus Sumerlaeia bacterium]|nr:MotA/TolQ/ExbB proton channel family protein [Candidatus Sumerlaeia bacterium]
METAWQRYVADGGIMMVFLVPMALLVLAFTIQGFLNLRRSRIIPRGYNSRLVEALLKTSSVAEVRRVLESEHHSMARILVRVLDHLEFKRDADPAEVLHETIEEECTVLIQTNSQLAVVYNVAPLMGLLGTVFGMIQTFREFAFSDDPNLRQLSQGIDVALLTTAWGLSIAIPAFIFLYLFTRKIQYYENILLPQEGQRALQRLIHAIGYERTSTDNRSVKPVSFFEGEDGWEEFDPSEEDDDDDDDDDRDKY